MTLYEEILAKCTPEQIVSGHFHEITAAVNVGRGRRAEALIGPGSVQNVLGPDDGAAVLDAIDAASAASPALKWGMVSLMSGKLDVSLDSTRGMFDLLAAGGLMTQPQADALKALAIETPDPVSWEACRTAIEQGA
jgi:hypothetical protein